MPIVNCDQCNGTGVYTDPLLGDITCPPCGGTGKIETDWVGIIRSTKVVIDTLATEIADIKDKVNDIKEKCDEIMELMQEHPWW